MANRSPWQKAFAQGYACAVANIIRTHGEDGIAWDVFVANKCEPKECDESDREVLQKAGFFKRGARMETGSAPGLKCPKCLIDRTKEPCPETTSLNCPMVGTASNREVNQ